MPSFFHIIGISKCLSQLPDRNAVLYQAIRNAQWPILDGELSEEVLFMFDDHGNGNTGYNVYNYRTEETDEMEYVKVRQHDGTLMYQYKWNTDTHQICKMSASNVVEIDRWNFDIDIHDPRFGIDSVHLQTQSFDNTVSLCHLYKKKHARNILMTIHEDMVS